MKDWKNERPGAGPLFSADRYSFRILTICSPMILVTGATGTIGRRVLRLLSERGIPTRALSRNPSQGETLPHVEWAEADLGEPETLPSVFDGANRLFILTGNARSMTRLQKNAIDAAANAGVEHVVKLSARGADPGSKSAIGQWHHEVETYLKAAGPTWTMLRPHVFMQNLLGQAERIRSQGEIRAPSGEGRIPLVDIRDIADVAAQVLTEDGHGKETYILTGGEAIDYHQVAGAIGTATKQDVEYVPESFDEARARFEDEGLPDWLIDSKLALAWYHRAGGATARTTRDIYDVTGQPPRTIVQFAYDYKSAFSQPA
ncbi:hypothetical protein BSZ35_18485 [Salinibacter sp. 10B]|nr:hypothetical protein BSZ35_18485 [Salinibacter sp. 10B]